MLEDLIKQLITAINANTKAVNQFTTDSEVLDDDVAATPVKQSKKKTSKKKTAKKTAAAVGGNTTQTTEVVDPAQPLDATKVQTHLRGIASQLTDTSKLFALIQQHGGQQFSDLDPSVYAALIADAEQLVADGA